MSLKSAIERMKTNGVYTVTRNSPPTYTKGRKVDGATSTFTITASIQPLTGNDMRLLPEGSRADNTKTLFTSTQLNTVGTAEPDSVLIDNVVYQVWNVEKWEGFGEIYYRTLVRKED